MGGNGRQDKEIQGKWGNLVHGSRAASNPRLMQCTMSCTAQGGLMQDPSLPWGGNSDDISVDVHKRVYI
jgi:hypothetical protein